MPNSSERRVTVNNTIYPKLEAWAKRDGVTVADVANAILLQTIQPYGAVSSQAIAPAAAPMQRNNFPDPYQAAAAVSDWG
ncbi:MAG: hypothetical protein WA947_18360 [Phormidesmis sp.]